MSSPPSYHQFIGNGIDALLIGPSGAMSPDRACELDRCYWYKSDLYYADSRNFDPSDDPRTFAGAPPGGTNFQLAPLARVWYEVFDTDGTALDLTASEQEFDPSSGTLSTIAWYGRLRLEIRTQLAGSRPALFIDMHASEHVTVCAHAAPGLWPEDIEQVDPIDAVWPAAEWISGLYFRVGHETCSLYLVQRGENGESTACLVGSERTSPDAWLVMRGSHMQWWAVLESTRYPDEIDTYKRLPPTQQPPRSRPMATIDIPDRDYSRMHGFSLYMFRAMQHRYSGGIPVNNLRRTFNSHVFWDGAFVQRALLEAGEIEAAREAWRFLGRTQHAAAANARDTFGSPGLHWDWETTHRGERAYVPWLQQRFQVHNTPLLAHMILADYRATRDRACLAEGYDLLAGAATFLLHAVLVDRDGVLETRPLVGSHEAAQPVINDGATVAACLRLLLDVALAARILGRQDELSRRCRSAAARLRPALANLYNGRFFQASRDEDRLNTSSLTPIFPADVVTPGDSRSLSTTAAYRARYAGRMAGHGNSEDGFPWSAGLLARILAYQGRREAAWEQLDLARVALCRQGGSAEYVDPQGHWNSQYFGTAQAALSSAINALLLQQHGSEVHLFPAIPAHWQQCGFQGFLAAGMRIEARFDHGHVAAGVRNQSGGYRTIVCRFGCSTRRLTLPPGAQQSLELENDRASDRG
jgi:hypothetical protein